MAKRIFNLSNLDGINGFRLDGVTAEDRSGHSVSTAGDVNGDGFDDLIVSAPGAYPNGKYSASNYVIFGKAADFNDAMNLSDLDGSNGLRLDGVASDERSLSSISNAGDVNGDGFDDLIIGAFYATPNGHLSGSSYVVFGKASGFDARMSLSDLDGKNGFRLDGTEPFDWSGQSVSGAGDINGDGFDDVIIGAFIASNQNGSASGSSYVVFGKASGFDATMDLSDIDGANGFRLDGETEYDNSGSSVSGAGDVNGDGFDDVIVGAYFAGSNESYPGSSYVVFGKASGFEATISLSDLDGSNGFSMDGVFRGNFSGCSVSNAGDVNGDGFDDLIIGSFEQANPSRPESGSSYVVFGKASGFDASMKLSELDGNNGFRLDGDRGDRSGVSVSDAGDFNGDGFNDLIVGAPGADSNVHNSGSSYVIFGKASGFEAKMSLSKLDESSGFRLDGVATGDYLGKSVSSAGDVNGDGFDDLIVGAFGADPNGASNSGSSYVIFGRSNFTGEVDFRGTLGDDNFYGTFATEVFEGNDGSDLMIGNGGEDSFNGGTGNDYIRISDASFRLVDGGTGNDILGLAGSGFHLDLSSVQDKIQGIETISLYGVGDNSLTLTAADVINLSNEKNTLKIKGNTGDSVAGLSSGWADGGVHGNFHEYTQGEAVLLIGVSVTTDFA